VVSGAYRDLFIAIAGAAGALTGLLFVALSVAPRPRTGQSQDVIRQVRAAAALLAFTNALAVSLFGLVPHNEIGYPAAVFGVIGVLFTLGGVRSILADPVARTQVRGQFGLVVLLLAAFGVEVVVGFISITRPHGTVAIDVIGNVLAGSLLIGIARSWELVGDRDYVLPPPSSHSPGTSATSGAPWPVRPMSPRTTPAVRASPRPRLAPLLVPRLAPLPLRPQPVLVPRAARRSAPLRGDDRPPRAGNVTPTGFRTSVRMSVVFRRAVTVRGQRRSRPGRRSIAEFRAQK
jgi:hypothetical protein